MSSAASGIPSDQVVIAADNLEAVAVDTPTIVLGLIGDGHGPIDVVTSMIRDAMAVAEGELPTIETVRQRLDAALGLGDQCAFPLTPLDPRRPARDMLEALLDGIRGCWLVYRECAGEADFGVVDDEFRRKVRAEARSRRSRLALAG